MTTITAIPQPATASVALTITPTGSVTTVLRTDANGINPVRTLIGQLPTGGAFVLIDNEAALVGEVLYTVIAGAAGASVLTALDVASPWLTIPITPAYSSPLGLVTGYTAPRESTSRIHQVINRIDPLVTLGALGLRTGTLSVWCADYAQARTLEAVYDHGEVVMLRQVEYPGLDMYHVATRTGINPQSESTPIRRWSLDIDYVEVLYPLGSTVGTLGWSIDDVTAMYPTVSALALAFAKVNDLTIGPS